MLSSPLAPCSTDGYPSLQFDTSRPTLPCPPVESYGLQSRGTISSQLAGLTVSSPSVCSLDGGKQDSRAGCESPAESNSFKKTRRGKRAGKNLRLRNAESELRRRSVEAMHSGDDSPRSWTPRSQLDMPSTPRTGPATPRTAPVTPIGPRGTPLTPRMAPITPPAASSTVWAPHRSHAQAKSPWDSPTPLVPSPLSYERHTTPDRPYSSNLDPLDSAYCGRADAAWNDDTEEPRSARISVLQQQQHQLRSTGSAPSTLSRRLHFTEGPAWPPSRHSIAEPSRLSALPRIDSARAMTQPGAEDVGVGSLSRVPTWEALADAARQLNLPWPAHPPAHPGMAFRGPCLGDL